MPHDQMHSLKTLIFTHLRFIKAVASDQHNFANNIKLIKGVHQLTPRPNTLISLIYHSIFNGWMDSRADLCADPGFLSGEGGPGPTARIQDPHMGPIHRNKRTYVRTYVSIHPCMHCHSQKYTCMHSCIHNTYIHTYIHMHAQTGT